MSIDHEEELAMTGDIGQKACAIRLRAARFVTGMEQKDLAKAVGMSKTTLNNAECGRAYPNRAVMRYLYRNYRIEHNFLMHGDLSYLPGDVRSQLLVGLHIANGEWDRRSS